MMDINAKFLYETAQLTEIWLWDVEDTRKTNIM